MACPSLAIPSLASCTPGSAHPGKKNPPASAGTGRARARALTRPRLRCWWPGSEQLPRQPVASCGAWEGSACAALSGGGRLGIARVQDCRHSRTRKCRCRAQAFDVHEALSAEAARHQRNIPCDVCTGRGWLLCDFCGGKKTEVPAKTGRMYRRCPSCKAVGVLMCTECRVYKCTTFPDGKDGGFEMD